MKVSVVAGITVLLAVSAGCGDAEKAAKALPTDLCAVVFDEGSAPLLSEVTLDDQQHTHQTVRSRSEMAVCSAHGTQGQGVVSYEVEVYTFGDVGDDTAAERADARLETECVDLAADSSMEYADKPDGSCQAQTMATASTSTLKATVAIPLNDTTGYGVVTKSVGGDADLDPSDDLPALREKLEDEFN